MMHVQCILACDVSQYQTMSNTCCSSPSFVDCRFAAAASRSANRRSSSLDWSSRAAFSACAIARADQLSGSHVSKLSLTGSVSRMSRECLVSKSACLQAGLVGLQRCLLRLQAGLFGLQHLCHRRGALTLMPL